MTCDKWQAASGKFIMILLRQQYNNFHSMSLTCCRRQAYHNVGILIHIENIFFLNKFDIQRVYVLPMYEFDMLHVLGGKRTVYYDDHTEILKLNECNV